MLDIVATAWGTGLRKGITLTAGTLSAVGAAVTTVPPAWSALGLPEAASKAYVHERVEPLRMAQTATATAVDRLLKSQLETQLYAAQQDPAAKTSPTVQQRVQELQQQIDDVARRLNANTGSGR